ncbi:MAG: carboxylesterase family protein [Propionibacteriaceae bacterium]|jgi:para-nitrobenzyl esterase|nr:carboxylesterase family protein [Propionibacteriaceae bacterium]
MGTNPTTRISSGEVCGLVKPNQTLAFLGIPYQSDPTDNPYAPPAAAPAWAKPLLAQSYGPSAPQPPDNDPIVPAAIIPPGPGGYLNLNVFTADLSGSRPVMVYIHGGSFIAGSNAFSWYDGSHLAAEGAVVVTINYRLGVYGFSPLGEPGAGITPNLGLRDMIAALAWVRDNIAAFGGDPARVTVWGQSAGAVAICALLAAPSAKGLFHRAIVQSASPNAVLAPADAVVVARQLALARGVDPADKMALARKLRTAPADELAAAASGLAASVLANPDPAKWGSVAIIYLPFAPQVDGEVLPTSPIEAARAGMGNDIELLIGYNADEFNLFTIPSGLADAIDQPTVELLAALRGLSPADLESFGARPGQTDWGSVWNAFMTDCMYRRASVELVETRNRAGAKPSYLYQFAWPSPAFAGRLGACHALEIPFAFGTMNEPGVSAVVGEDVPDGLSDEVRSAWLAFAATGAAPWPAYQADNAVFRRFDTESRNIFDPSVPPSAMA